MKREEKIELLEKEKAYMLSHGGDRQAIALGAAIEALNQEPCEDAVSRQAIIDEMEKRHAEGDCITKGFVKNLPSVTPQPKTGHWIIIDDCEQFIAKCSECGRIEDSRMISKYPYCHCGAKMVEPQESED